MARATCRIGGRPPLITKALLPLLICATALAATSFSVCAEEADAGLVKKIEPPDGQYYVIRRGSGETHIERPIVLRDGDEIYLVDLETRLTLKLIGEETDVIVSRFNERPYPVKRSTRNDGMGWAILSWFINEMAPREELLLTHANIRGDVGQGFSIHLLDNLQRIAAGRRSIAIAWKIEKGSSVTVAIRALGASEPIAATTSTEGAWTSPPLDLKPGLYTFEFGSRSFGSKERLVRVINPDELPRPQTDWNSQSSEGDLQTTLEAAVLASQGEGSFVLEAFQTVSPLASRVPAAKLLEDVLMDVAWTKKPP
jgi:hypothetical protein